MDPIAKHTELELVDKQSLQWSFGPLISSVTGL
jgi:hypothetical protein